jgi:membrane dipeptidase
MFRSSLAAVFVVAAWLALPVEANAADQPPPAERERPPVELTLAARELHRQLLLIDGHNDLPWALRERADTQFQKLDIAQLRPELHTDIPRLRQGNVGAQFWSAYVPADTSRRGEALRMTLEQIELVQRMLKRYPHTFEMASTADDIERIYGQGKIASMIGIEGGHCIEDSLANLRRLYDLGARYMTLTHSDTLAWADSATDDARHGGLAPFGEEVVREMNRLGMLVDLSHVSAETMHDAIRVSRAPVIFSHSSAFAIAPHPRNVPDDVLRQLPKHGGVVMVNFFSGFVVRDAAEKMRSMFAVRRKLREQYPDDKEYEAAVARWRRENPIPRGTVQDVVDHIDHIVKTAGIDHVGIGSDFDGVTSLPRQLEDVSYYPYITQELLNRGYKPDQIRQIMGGNVLRVLRAAERVKER